MATLTVKLTLTSNSATTDILELALADVLTISNPAVNVGRVSVPIETPVNFLTTANNTVTYIYVKNIDITNSITIKTDAAVSIATLAPGEFMFLPLKEAVGLEAQASGAPCVAEYGYWTKS
jgi:hypothetical protein